MAGSQTSPQHTFSPSQERLTAAEVGLLRASLEGEQSAARNAELVQRLRAEAERASAEAEKFKQAVALAHLEAEKKAGRPLVFSSLWFHLCTKIPLRAYASDGAAGSEDWAGYASFTCMRCLERFHRGYTAEGFKN